MNRVKSELQEFLEVSEHRKLYEQERLLVDANELLVAVMQKKRIGRADLAKRLGKSKAFVTQVLRGKHNLTLRTLADLFGAMEYRVAVQAVPSQETTSQVSDFDYTEPLDCYKWITAFHLLPTTLAVPLLRDRRAVHGAIPGIPAGELLSQGVAA